MILVIMGVTGAGKTTVGKLLANKLGWRFIEADDYHSKVNIRKMNQGIPLNDEDRVPWLKDLNKILKYYEAISKNAVLSCSALKGKYRLILADNMLTTEFILLEAGVEDIEVRLDKRKGHFMNPVLLRSQFNDLDVSEYIFCLDATLSPDQISSLIISKYNLSII